ncbi:DUF5110 domain-containing protein [Streptomyces sp. NPDC050263]|uniref:DUF5110 domain-containing protein n=1 Tax=Streptomyces sp. NPDC050263 TaxID=3155037 RepID=UPI003440C0BA
MSRRPGSRHPTFDRPEAGPPGKRTTARAGRASGRSVALPARTARPRSARRGVDGRCDLYDDAGDGFGYEQGEFTYTSLHRTDAEARFFVETPTGAGTGIPAHRDFRTVVVGTSGGLGSGRPAS